MHCVHRSCFVYTNRPARNRLKNDQQYFFVVELMSIKMSSLRDNLVSALVCCGKLASEDGEWSVNLARESDFLSALRSTLLSEGYDVSCKTLSSNMRQVTKELMVSGGHTLSLLIAFCRLTSRVVDRSLARSVDDSAKERLLQRGQKSKAASTHALTLSGARTSSSWVSSSSSASSSSAIVPMGLAGGAKNHRFRDLVNQINSASPANLVSLAIDLAGNSIALEQGNASQLAKLQQVRSRAKTSQRQLVALKRKYSAALVCIERLKRAASFKQFGKRRRATAQRENFSIHGGYRLALMKTVCSFFV